MVSIDWHTKPVPQLRKVIEDCIRTKPWRRPSGRLIRPA
jgi:hypothetical protein